LISNIIHIHYNDILDNYCIADPFVNLFNNFVYLQMSLTERSIGTVNDINGKIIEDECSIIVVPLSQVNYLKLFKLKVYLYLLSNYP